MRRWSWACSRVLLVAFATCVYGHTVVAAGTDVVHLAGGDRVLGSVILRKSDGTLVVGAQRSWLAQAEPRLLRLAAADEPQRSRAALEGVVQRIDGMLAEPAGSFDQSLIAFLRREQARLKAVLSEDRLPEPQFVLLEFTAAQVRGLDRADPAWRRLVQWGWHEQLERVETLPQQSLADQLTERGIDTSLSPPSLLDRLPPLPQDDDQWRARVALLQDAYGASVSFQGTGDIVVRSDQEVTIDALLPVVTDMLKGDVGGLLDLFGGGRPRQAAADRWLVSARSQAGSDGRFRATRVQTKPDQGVVEVESAFEVRLEDGSWATVWRAGERIDATRPREALEERIAADPRVGQAINAIKVLGVVDDEAMTEAIRFGAATMEAQELIDRQFAAFRSDHTLQLDGPPLMVIRQPAAR